MRPQPGPRIDTTILGAATLLALAMGSGSAPTEFEFAPPSAAATTDPGAPAHAGVWLSADGTVRLTLAPDGTYERSVAGRKRAARGTYRLAGLHLVLRDDNGLRTTATVVDDSLEVAGHRLYRA
jgi:hypothetical protein